MHDLFARDFDVALEPQASPHPSSPPRLTLVPPAAVLAEPPQAADDPGQALAAAWREYVRVVQTADAQFDRLHSSRQPIFPDAPDWRPRFGPPFCARSLLGENAAALVISLVGHAERTFAPPGCARLSIAYGPLIQRFLDREHPETFDPGAVWDDLAQTYSGHKGADLAYHRAAREIARTLDLRPGRPVKRRGNAVVVERSVWTERENYNRHQLSYGSREELHALLGHLQTFAGWAEADAVVSGLRVLAQLWSHTYQVRSRERLPVSPELHVVTYFRTFEFVFAAPLAERLQMFLSLFGQEVA